MWGCGVDSKEAAQAIINLEVWLLRIRAEKNRDGRIHRIYGSRLRKKCQTGVKWRGRWIYRERKVRGDAEINNHWVINAYFDQWFKFPISADKTCASPNPTLLLGAIFFGDSIAKKSRYPISMGVCVCFLRHTHSIDTRLTRDILLDHFIDSFLPDIVLNALLVLRDARNRNSRIK